MDGERILVVLSSISNYNPIHMLIHIIKEHQVPSPSKSLKGERRERGEREERERVRMVAVVAAAAAVARWWGGGDEIGRRDCEADLGPNHGWWVSGEEPKGTKISPRITCRCFELHFHDGVSKDDEEIY